MHKSEVALTSSSATLAKLSLKKLNIHIRGDKEISFSPSFINEEKYTPLYLYPGEDAHELTREFIQALKKPVQLIVPDGTWRQTKNLQRRESKLRECIMVKLPSKQVSHYFLRKQKYDYGLCTHEAIAYALGIIEGTIFEQALMKNLQYMVEAHLLARKRRVKISKLMT